MTRLQVLGGVVLAGSLSIAGAAARGQPADDRRVTMQTLSVYDILYVLTGGGGNTLALMRDDGIVLVDTKLPGWGQAMLDAMGAVSDKPVTTIINTHTHADHTGGNREFPTVVQVIAHENTKVNMSRMKAFEGANARFLPNKTVSDKLSLFDGLDQIDLYYFGAGHTNGDLIVVFPNKKVAHVGDLFPSKAAPIIDTANGGSGLAYPDTLARAVASIKGVDRVVTGHFQAIAPMRGGATGSAIFANPQTMRWSDLQEYADFMREFVTAVQEASKAGKSADEAASTLKLSERFKDYDMQQARAGVQAIYNELKK
jgi:cyclase